MCQHNQVKNETADIGQDAQSRLIRDTIKNCDIANTQKKNRGNAKLRTSSKDCEKYFQNYTNSN